MLCWTSRLHTRYLVQHSTIQYTTSSPQHLIIQSSRNQSEIFEIMIIFFSLYESLLYSLWKQPTTVTVLNIIR
ncbi:hypothetical protein EYC80_010023 [Monilinia laxa]|uniref:Uncharacterized protein n=1 Tax=Monilinia laxa TaxID=61186 RepID=A0A5N6JST4_MONLA|nr:hypothetical protein EYC80_010023 [Monilinia laxa]